jgi:hypothetical protein
MSKYYTPTIEEFHVGFEYEIKPFNKEWGEHDRTFIYPEGIYNYTRIHGIESLESPIKKECVRVKYLDREDIESLGFVYSEECIYYTPKRNFQLNHKETHVYNLRVIDEENAEVIFIGYIKNKSELKRLLKQLKIIE